MSEKIERFFGEKGLSLSEANHLSNLATQSAEFLSKELKQMNFISSTFKHEGEIMDLKIASDFNEDKISELILTIGQLYGFVSWVREACKAHTEHIGLINDEMFVSESLKNEQKALRDELSNLCLQTPSLSKVTEQDIFDEMPIKEYQDYLSNVAFAAHIGKFIHEDSHFEKALSEIIKLEPTTFKQRGDLNIVISNISTVSATQLKETLDKLRKLHRNYEKQVNRVKAIVKDKVSERNLINAETYRIELAEHEQKVRDMRTRIKDIDTEISKKTIEQTQAFSKKKLIIPHMLEGILDDLRTI